MNAIPLFHLAFPVHDLAAARHFYGELLGCPEGRSSDAWIDFNFYGHQVVAHLSPDECGHRATSAVDGDDVPVRHFGAILPMTEWEALADKLRAAGTRFVIEPHVRFKGQVGEQATMFFLDPSGNALEFKAFGDEPGLREVTPHTIHPSQDNPARHDRIRHPLAPQASVAVAGSQARFPIRRVLRGAQLRRPRTRNGQGSGSRTAVLLHQASRCRRGR
jgi:extradiol dioxygenase family protein